MSAPRPARRARRVVAAASLLGAAGLFLAPTAAFADSYNNTSVAPSTEVLGVKYGPATTSSGSDGSSGSGAASGTAVLGTKYASSSSSLAFTGFEAGAVGLVGAGLVVGGTVLIISGRRRTARD